MGQDQAEEGYVVDVLEVDRRANLVRQVRKIASRGHMDDADVQIIFDAADEIDRLWDVIQTYSNQYER